MALEIGQRIGDYEVVALLGAGGMGRVYRVRNIISNREEAMKVLLPDYASEAELAARFMAEIRTLAGLEHPNIAQLRTAFQFQNQLVMIMEFVEGTTLDKLATNGPIPLDRVLDYSSQVLSALSYAHGKGVTHRDIKPANIMITSHGLVKLMDFGIAKSTNDMQLTRPGTTMGSVYYMSPEQVRGGPVDARSDIYSFGVTLYEMLTGRKPFQADTSYSVLNAQLNEAPTPPAEINPSVSPDLNNIVLRAMVKSPAGRFQTADEFRNALKAISAQSTQQSGYAPVPASQPVPAAAENKGHRGLWIGLGATAAILAIVVAATLLPHVFRTNAGQRQIAPSAGPQEPSSSTPASSPAPDTAPQVNPLATATPQANPSEPAAARKPYRESGPTQTTNHAAAPANPPNPLPPQPTSPSQQEIRTAHDRYANLEARADAVRSGIQQLRTQQQAQGLDIRGDILGSLNRMNSAMNEANSALSRNDLQTADEYMDRADREVSILEQFLNIR